MATSHTNAFVAPRPVKNLVLIEAPGKLGTLAAALKRIKLGDFHILATQGHIMDYSKDLGCLGIDAKLNETGRHVVRPQIVETIAQWAQGAERILIATDADQEGDVIAQDLMDTALTKHPRVQRVHLRSLDVSGVTHAFASAKSMRASDAWPGAARRVLDRLIGATFGVFNGLGSQQVSVGRVQSGLLGAASSKPLPVGVATLVLPCATSREPYSARVLVCKGGEARIQDLMGRCREFASQGGVVQTGESQACASPKPWCYGEGVLAMAKATGRSIEEVALSMQRLYETGRLSYPRSSSNSMTPFAIDEVDQVAQRHGARFDGSRIARFTPETVHAHEAAHPLGLNMDLTTPAMLLGKDDAILALLAKHLISCGQPHAMHRPDQKTLPAWADGLEFAKCNSAWITPWPKRTTEIKLDLFSAEMNALALMLEHQLGRPSTQVGHAVKFAARGLVDSQMALTQRAHQWRQGTPVALLDARVSKGIERILEQRVGPHADAGTPSIAVQEILKGLNLWGDVQALIGKDTPAEAKIGSMGRATNF